MSAAPQPGLSEEIRARCAAFVGRSREVDDTLAPEAAEKLAVLLGREPPGDYLPPTYHWLYFNRGIAAADVGIDMHEKTGRFLPPAPFDRRMWASGKVAMLQPLRIGTPATRVSRISSVDFKTGKTGAMCFVNVSHQIEQGGVPCIEEVQTIVYRDRGIPETSLRAPDDPVPEGYFTYPDSKLFFYSAITHNGHRIHWDRDHCRTVEDYPDLVVHGPLMATELCEILRDDLVPLNFNYRALAPVFTSSPVRIVLGAPGTARTGEIERSDRVTSMTARLTPL